MNMEFVKDHYFNTNDPECAKLFNGPAKCLENDKHGAGFFGRSHGGWWVPDDSFSEVPDPTKGEIVMRFEKDHWYDTNDTDPKYVEFFNGPAKCLETDEMGNGYFGSNHSAWWATYDYFFEVPDPTLEKPIEQLIDERLAIIHSIEKQLEDLIAHDEKIMSEARDEIESLRAIAKHIVHKEE
jgi:hypothetical protein